MSACMQKVQVNGLKLAGWGPKNSPHTWLKCITWSASVKYSLQVSQGLKFLNSASLFG